ncbi:MAG TPA: SUMF1/EgtB/PvdO family nonheme iron enzyme [Dokdonella sp.]|nr:SUMF1/EgtB/PvdO family nonheme iron enzyme [Dokdonella sp.]
MQWIQRFAGTAGLALVAGCAPMAARDCAYCPDMVVVPAGTALLGAGAADRFGRPDEKPERHFEIARPFAVSRHEITRREYETFVLATQRPILGDCLTDRMQRGTWVIDAGTTFRDPGFAQGDDHPVACVSWDEAQAYVAWLNAQTSGGFRLLTEVEWEYVARAGATRATSYPWGDDPAQACAFANGFDRTTTAAYAGIDTSAYPTFDPLPCDDGWLNTAPVGSLSPNAFGVYDAIGNVGEWIDDCYSDSHDALTGSGVLPEATTPCTRRIAKGGSWGTLAHNLRTAERVPYAPTHRDDSIGIRVARTLP